MKKNIIKVGTLFIALFMILFVGWCKQVEWDPLSTDLEQGALDSIKESSWQQNEIEWYEDSTKDVNKTFEEMDEATEKTLREIEKLENQN